MNVLIAGHGYLGEPLAGTLQEAGHSVTALTKSDPAGPEDARPYPVRSGDLSDRESLARLDPAPEAIVHCASSNRGGPDAYRAVFIEGVGNLTALFPGVPLILTSSTSVYGQVDGSVVTEDSPAEPERETSRLLRAAEVGLLEAGGTVLRLAGIYGPGRSVYLKRFFEGTATIETGETSRYLNQVHRDDAVSAIVHVLERNGGSDRGHRGEIYNLADDRPLTQRECLEGLAERFDRPVPPESPPDHNRKRAWTNKRVSNEKLRATGWTPKYPDFFAAVENDPDLVPSIRAMVEDG